MREVTDDMAKDSPPSVTARLYLSSPDPPPDTRAEFLVLWRYSNEQAGTKRRLFHSYAKAAAFRTQLERPERQADNPHPVSVFVAIYRRDVRPWREIP